MAKVYVGTIEFPYGRMIMFHMASTDLDSLHEMADKIGIRRKWFQNKLGHPHYDICKSKKKKAIEFGAIEINDRELIKICYPDLWTTEK